MTIGLSGSGKTRATEYISDESVKILSSDAIRKELFGDEGFQGDNEKVFSTLNKRVKEELLNGNSVVYDATNLSYKKRTHFLKQYLRKVDCVKVAWVFVTPVHICIENDSKRERTVGREVIMKQLKRFNFPLFQEGFDEIKLRHMEFFTFSEDDEFMKSRDYYMSFKQENKNHSLTLGWHMIKTSGRLIDKYGYVEKPELILAGRLHDIGKPITKSFTNTKGEITENATYYSHDNVSAYLSMFYYDSVKSELNYLEFIRMVQLINWHMKPYFFEKEKTVVRYKNFLGEEFFNDLMELHEADKLAH